jgi:hypothetical protein
MSMTALLLAAESLSGQTPGYFMIMGQNGQLLPKTTHDHDRWQAMARSGGAAGPQQRGAAELRRQASTMERQGRVDLGCER